MTQWKEYKLSDLMELIGGGTPKTSVSEYWGGDIPWLSVTDFNTGRKYCFDTEKKVTEKGLKESSTKILKKGQIIISARGTVGVLSILGKDMAFNQSNYGIEANENLTSNDFLYYLLKLKIPEFLSNSYGAVFDTITKETFKHISVLLPSIPEQKIISSILSSLDDKIDLLYRQNKTLEQLAETLFRQWFVEEAEESWEEKPLKEVCDIINGFAFKSENYKNNGRIIIRTMNFKNGFIELDQIVHISIDQEENYKKYKLRRFDFLLVMVGANLGNYSIVTSDILPALQNQNMWNFRSKSGFSQYYLIFAIRRIVKDNLNIASGSAREFFQKGQFYKLPILSPDKNILMKFDYFIESLYTKIENNRNQIRILTQLRDILLPKLMSGEMRVGM